MSDPYQSRNEGLTGQAMSAGGDLSEYQAGRGIKAWNDAELARQNAPIPMTPLPIGGPTPSGTTSYPTGGGGGFAVPGMRGGGNALMSIVGFVLLIFVGIPYYYLAIPLWMCLYPAGASVALGVFVVVFRSIGNDATFTGSGHIVAPAIVAFIVAWPATLGDQILAGNSKAYWIVRHWIRLALIGVWAVYALSRYEGTMIQFPRTGSAIPPLNWSAQNIGLALVAVVVMHVFLSRKPVLRNAWSRLRGRESSTASS